MSYRLVDEALFQALENSPNTDPQFYKELLRSSIVVSTHLMTDKTPLMSLKALFEAGGLSQELHDAIKACLLSCGLLKDEGGG